MKGLEDSIKASKTIDELNAAFDHLGNAYRSATEEWKTAIGGLVDTTLSLSALLQEAVEEASEDNSISFAKDPRRWG